VIRIEVGGRIYLHARSADRFTIMLMAIFTRTEVKSSSGGQTHLIDITSKL